MLNGLPFGGKIMTRFLHFTFSRDLVTRPGPSQEAALLPQGSNIYKKRKFCLPTGGRWYWRLNTLCLSFQTCSEFGRILQKSVLDNLIFAWWIQTFHFSGHDTRSSANNTTLEKKGKNHVSSDVACGYVFPISFTTEHSCSFRKTRLLLSLPLTEAL